MENRKRREWPVVVYFWTFGLAALGYILSNLGLSGVPHSFHWINGFIGGGVGILMPSSSSDLFTGDAMSTLTSKTLRTLTILLIPIILILGTVRLLTTDGYLSFEYGKASFPPDVYGFTPQQRFILASTNIHYVRAHLPDN